MKCGIHIYVLQVILLTTSLTLLPLPIYLFRSSQWFFTTKLFCVNKISEGPPKGEWSQSPMVTLITQDVFGALYVSTCL